MKKLCLLLILTIAVTLLSIPAFAGPRLNYGQALNAAQCNPNTGKMVLNVVLQVTNDADSGFGGYWAIDTYSKHIQAFDQGGGTFCVIVKYHGTFVTVAGNSPSGTAELSAGVTGTMEGGYMAVMTGASFTPKTGLRTKGNIGAKDYGCTITNGQLNAGCTPYDWVSDYFSGASLTFEYAGVFQWGWVYSAGDNGSWTNANSGSSGDITGS